MQNDKVKIELTKSEAIVFFEFICRFNKIEEFDQFEDKSEQRVLWDIECMLENELIEPFRTDYLEIVAKSRENVRGKEE